MTSELIVNLLFASVLIAVILYTLWSWRWGQAAKFWPTTTGTVLWAEIDTETDEDGDTHTPKIHYSYRIDGKVYESRRISYGWLGSAEYTNASDTLHGLYKNVQVVVYYDPTNPRRSVLHPGTGAVSLYIIPICFLLLWVVFNLN